MKKHEILSPQSRTAVFDPPTDAGAIVRHYTFSLDDMALIRQRRRAANRLGFAVNLAYLRLPGRVLGIEEIPPAYMLAYIAKQIICEPASFDVYAQRGETRREHLGELQAYLDVRCFQRDDKRAIAHVAVEQAVGSDRGDVIVSSMIEYLRERRILLPAAVTLENIALAARALARKRAYKSLGEGLSPETIADWKPCSSSPKKKSARCSLGCGNGRKRRVRGTSSKPLNGSKPCASSASEPIVKSAFTARDMRQSRAKARL